jgi:hypothetical protein
VLSTLDGNQRRKMRDGRGMRKIYTWEERNNRERQQLGQYLVTILLSF